MPVCLGMYDNSLESEQVSLREPNDGFFFRGMSIWIQCLQQCSNPQIVVQDLQDQFMKLFFKLLSRFELWFCSSIDHLLKSEVSCHIRGRNTKRLYRNGRRE